ncbi:hypothetical protein SI65_00288 [Aspergillus cristatus]|uniref:Serine aminopeptidase S33 domain-containing protein n=1 Tax=Aspergillus cristatus TaxID=573508 RepID=A0A1E3BP23_ASPCR|nr:hypothetical protein SI65_00288 [Aspergillus cristatus]
MATSGPFRIVEHVVPGEHIREYPAATANVQEEMLYLAVKQYIPLDNPNPQPGDVTIIGAHANGFPKELYEPLWEEIYKRSKANGFCIRSIWMADVAHQGRSSVINEDRLGNDPSWFDHPRDLLHLINMKRDEMPRPLIGIGHSMGGAHIAQLSLIHPRLFHTIILLDPVIQRQSSTHESQSSQPTSLIAKTVQLSTYRRDIWPSRKAAAESYKKSPFYQAWDPRVLERWVQYGLRDLPTAIHPLGESQLKAKDAKDRYANHPVTLTSTLHQEVFTYSRPNYDRPPGTDIPVNKMTHPDLDPSSLDTYPFYRPETSRIFAQLPHLRPSVLYIFGSKSDISLPEVNAEKMATTGTGVGGSGGAQTGRVRDVTLDKIGHLVAQEAPVQCAEAGSSWLGQELQRWRDEDQAFRAEWSKKSKIQKVTVDARWKEYIPPPVRKSKKTPSKL